MSNSREVTEELRLQKRLRKSAWEEWMRGRAKTRIPSFNSKSAKSKVDEFVNQACMTEDEMDVLQAVHELAREPDGAPWDIPKRAMRIGGQRRDLERTARRFEEREIDARVAKVLRQPLADHELAMVTPGPKCYECAVTGRMEGCKTCPYAIARVQELKRAALKEKTSG